MSQLKDFINFEITKILLIFEEENGIFISAKEEDRMLEQKDEQRCR